MGATYYLTVLPETKQLVSGIKDAVQGAQRDMVVSPKFDTKGAAEAGRKAGADVQAGLDSSARGGGIGRFLRADGARSAGQAAGSEVNAGLQSANIGGSVSTSLGRNLLNGAESLGRNVGSMIATGLKVTAAVGGTVLAGGIAGALHAGLSRLTAIDDAKFKLQGLGNSTEQVQNIMDNALAAVNQTAFGLDEAATTAASAVAAGIKPGEQLTGYLKEVADTAAIAGTSMADMGSIFNKVQTSGKAFTGDLNMLSDRGLPIFTWLQNEYKVSGEELSKMVSEGKVDAATFQRVIAENIGGAAQKMGGSIRGQLSNLKAAYSRFGAELAGPIFSAVSPLTIAFTGAFDKITKAIKPYTAQLTGIIGPWAQDMANKITAWLDNGGVQKVIDFMGRLVDRVQALRTGQGRSDALASITESVKTIGPALQQSGPALQQFGSSFAAFGQAIAAVGPSTISGVLTPALQVLAGALKFVADNASWAVPAIGGLVLAFGGLKLLASTVAPIVAALNGAFKIINTPVMLAQTAAIRGQAKAMEELTVALSSATVAQGANAASTEVNTVAQAANRSTSLGSAIALRAQAAATKVVTAAQWLWNAAMSANPIGIVIVAIAGIAAALWAFFTKTETGRKIWNTLWTGIKDVAGKAWQWIKDTFGKAWESIQPGLQKIGTIAREVFSTLGNAIKNVWTFIQPAVEWLGKLWLAVAKIEFKVAIEALKGLGSVIGWLWQNIVVPAFNGIATVIGAWWSGTQIVWGAASTAIQWVGDKIGWLWRNVAVPAFDGIKLAVTTWWDGVKFIWDLFTGALDKIGQGVGVFKDGIVTAFNAVKDVITTVWNAVGGIWDKIVNGIGTVTDALKGVGGKVANALGLGGGYTGGYVTGGSVLPGYADGGQIRGPGTGTSDSILGFPAMVRVANGEWITNAMATAQNLPLLRMINSGVPVWQMLKGLLPRFAGGGLVSAQELEKFASGVEGQPYKWGGVDWGDCSGAVSAIANYATGQDPFGSRFATATEGDELAKRGFKSGLGPSGSLNIGWYNGGPGGGHTAATLPDGTHFEMGGARGNGQFGGGAAGAEDSQFTNHMHLPPEWFTGLDGESGSTSGSLSVGASTSAGSSGGSYRAATSDELSASSSRVDSARTTAKNADQRVDDATYARDRAQDRLNEAKAKGKGVEDAQHSLDVKNRELQDAIDAQAKAHQKATDAENKDTELRTKGKATKGNSSSDGKGLNGQDFGKTFVSGVLESIGLDGSLFSNPLEWPTVKSAMAGVNFLGGLLSGKGQDDEQGAQQPGGFADGVADSVGLGGLFSALPKAGDDEQPGSPKLAPGDLNPAMTPGGGLLPSAGDALSAFVPNVAQQPQGQQGAQVDNSININGDVGMNPGAVIDTVHAEQNQRTRTTAVK
ncbi:endolysin [Mycobacterium phage Pixie]|uniref:Tape measure protein n=1 Tax=Mycobacterium phage Pixie TaxID=2922215 RepID=G1D529_9CAUD|nr:endolysin [Mycobacterium phage Pixie]AEK09832.1 tape measure protein [Mycobacterium phage Pixie]